MDVFRMWVEGQGGARVLADLVEVHPATVWRWMQGSPPAGRHMAKLWLLSGGVVHPGLWAQEVTACQV